MLPSVHQHASHDAIGTVSVGGNRLKVGLEGLQQIVDVVSCLLIESFRNRIQDLAELFQQLHGCFREVVHEVERIFDFVRDTGGQLAKRCHFL